MVNMSFLCKIIHHRKPNTNLLRCYSFSKTDPGINLRKKALDLNEDFDEFEFDDLETDFMNVHKTHKDHVKEIKRGLEKQKFHIVKQKYFKERQLNFLTWHDKEQIKYLYSTDPKEWTIEKLSEGFPVLPEVVKKIVKANWTLHPSKVTNHDRTVQRNWENFKNGQIPDLPKEVIDHLNKFTNRALNFKPWEAPRTKSIVNINTKSIGMEFSDIITSYNKLKAKKCNTKEELTININTETLKNASDSNNFNRNKKMSNKSLTLYELQSKLENKSNMGKNLSEDDKLLLKHVKRSPDAEEISVKQSQNHFEDIVTNKFEPNKSASSMKKEQAFHHLIYPEKITIPKDLQKEGYTYKLNDCYYDDDGVFLYRVPGMY